MSKNPREPFEEPSNVSPLRADGLHVEPQTGEEIVTGLETLISAFGKGAVWQAVAERLIESGITSGSVDSQLADRVRALEELVREHTKTL